MCLGGLQNSPAIPLLPSSGDTPDPLGDLLLRLSPRLPTLAEALPSDPFLRGGGEPIFSLFAVLYPSYYLSSMYQHRGDSYPLLALKLRPPKGGEALPFPSSPLFDGGPLRDPHLLHPPLAGGGHPLP